MQEVNEAREIGSEGRAQVSVLGTTDHFVQLRYLDALLHTQTVHNSRWRLRMTRETHWSLLPVVFCGVVWYCVALCGAVWCCVVLCGAVWCCVVLCGSVWCCVVLCGSVWCYIIVSSWMISI